MADINKADLNGASISLQVEQSTRRVTGAFGNKCSKSAPLTRDSTLASWRAALAGEVSSLRGPKNAMDD
jgi:hypothetical protein